MKTSSIALSALYAAINFVVAGAKKGIVTADLPAPLHAHFGRNLQGVGPECEAAVEALYEDTDFAEAAAKKIAESEAVDPASICTGDEDDLSCKFDLGKF